LEAQRLNNVTQGHICDEHIVSVLASVVA